jgi:hypothetical protein
MDKVVCAECGKQMSYINNKHLMSHSLTAEQYKQKYPNSLMKSQAVSDRLSKRSVDSNAARKGVVRSEKDLLAIREGVAKRASSKGIAKGPMSQETKDKISVVKKERYASGIFVHPNTGKNLDEQTKTKISKSLTGQKQNPDTNIKRQQTRERLGLPAYPSALGYKHTDEAKKIIGEKSSLWQKSVRPEVRKLMLERIYESNLTLLNDVVCDVFDLRCDKCGYVFTRTPQCFQPSKFNVEVCNQCFPRAPRSNAEIALGEFVQSIVSDTILYNDIELIKPLELDIFLPERGIAIEYCGLYWHSELQGKSRWYHRKKMDLCSEKNVRLITVFEDEWINKRPIIEGMLRNLFGAENTKTDARKCLIAAIEADVANKFVNENHIQGRGRSNARYGLFLDRELLAVMTFSKSEISRGLEGWEINRFCTKIGFNVRGGASRLFSAFLKEHTPEKVLSYADLRWGTGNVYRNLGFERVGITVPNYWYFRPDEMRRLHRYSLRKTGADPIDMTEWQIRQQQGWNRIWDCGHAKWVWHQKSS